MTIEQIEAEVLALPKDAQVLLLARLLERLGQDSKIDQEITGCWVEEAEKRDKDMDAHDAVGIPADEVFQQVRASLQ